MRAAEPIALATLAGGSIVTAAATSAAHASVAEWSMIIQAVAAVVIAIIRATETSRKNK